VHKKNIEIYYLQTLHKKSWEERAAKRGMKTHFIKNYWPEVGHYVLAI
jgi:hypothetical protein